jgi:hypothetical protein
LSFIFYYSLESGERSRVGLLVGPSQISFLLEECVGRSKEE